MTTTLPSKEEMIEKWRLEDFQVEFLHGVPVGLPMEEASKIAQYWLTIISERDALIKQILIEGINKMTVFDERRIEAGMDVHNQALLDIKALIEKTI